jgi:CheY-like chemotaxis protein
MSNLLTVLIVDDNASMRYMLRTVLTGEGYATLEAVDGVEAVDTLRLRSDRLIVLLDLVMPRMSGLDVLDVIDASGDLTRHVYIVMTSDKRTLDAAHAALLTHHHIPLMEKSFDLNGLVGEVARAANRLS